ncbi:MAG: hypothetical protein NTY07_14085 [Bacteroidia bacterium]|nr:hypothetical protein [Bacteroidia bacterium]
MKTRILIIAMLLISITGMAQRQFDPQTLELIKTKKIAFMTEQIGLTSQEAEKFWPVYNELEKQRFMLMDKKKELEEQSETPKAGMKDADYRKLAIEIAAAHAKEGKLIEEYNLKLLNILPAEKVVKLYRAEGKFRATLMHEFRKGQDDKRERNDKEKEGK